MAGQVDSKTLRRILSVEEQNALVLVAREGTTDAGIKVITRVLRGATDEFRGAQSVSEEYVRGLIESAQRKVRAYHEREAKKNGNGGQAMTATKEVQEEARRAREERHVLFRAALAAEGPIKQRRLREWLGWDGPHMSIAKQELIRLGHVQQSYPPDDSRSPDLSLTLEGREAFEGDPPVALSEVLGDLPPDRRAGLAPTPEPDPEPPESGDEIEDKFPGLRTGVDEPGDSVGDSGEEDEPIDAQEGELRDQLREAEHEAATLRGELEETREALGHARTAAREATDNANDVGAECSRLEADQLELHDTLVRVGLPGSINMGSIRSRIEQLARGRTRLISALVVLAHDDAGLLAQLLVAAGRGEPEQLNPHLVALAERTADDLLGDELPA